MQAPKPSVVSRNAIPKRVDSANGERSEYRRSIPETWSAFAQRITNADDPGVDGGDRPERAASRCTRRSTRGSTTPGRTSRRTPTTPIRSESETNSAQRATSSRHVTPEAPTASVGDGAGTPTPKVYTPFPTWPSAEISCQRTV